MGEKNPGRGRPAESVADSRRRWEAVSDLVQGGFKKKQAMRLVMLYEKFPNTPFMVALDYAVRKTGRRLSRLGPNRGRGGQGRREEAVEPGGSPADLLEAAEDESTSEVQRKRTTGGAVRDLVRSCEAVRKAVSNLQKRVAHQPVPGWLVVRATSVSIGPVKMADLPVKGSCLVAYQHPAWPPYSSALLGVPCTDSDYWANRVLYPNECPLGHEAQTLPAPPHRHCKNCHVAAIEGDPAVFAVLRFHPISLVPEFHGFTCGKCEEEVWDKLPVPTWDKILEDVPEDEDPPPDV